MIATTIRVPVIAISTAGDPKVWIRPSYPDIMIPGMALSVSPVI
jgi:hypothetical protein